MKAYGEKIYFLAFGVAVAVAIALIAGLGLAAKADARRIEAAYEAENRKLLDIFAAEKTRADLSMIVLGNSRLRNAFAEGHNPAQWTQLSNGRRMTILQFGLDGAGFFNFADMADDIVKIRPDYLVVMPNVLTNARANQPYLTGKAGSVSLYLDRLFSGGADPVETWKNDRSYLVADCYQDFPKKRAAQHLDLLAMRDAHDLSDKNEYFAKAKDFLKKAREAGTRVVILDLAANKAMLDAAEVQAHEVDYPGLGRAPSCGEIEAGTWLRYAPQAGASDYCDFMHLNEAGRKAFTAWLLEEAATNWRSADQCQAQPAP